MINHTIFFSEINTKLCILIKGQKVNKNVPHLLLQTGIGLSQYPVMWPGLLRQARTSDPSKLYPSLQRILHVEPYMLSHSPSTKPSSGGNNVWHRNTIEKRKTRDIRTIIQQRPTILYPS